jgi:hypothetical protein
MAVFRGFVCRKGVCIACEQKQPKKGKIKRLFLGAVCNNTLSKFILFI